MMLRSLPNRSLFAIGVALSAFSLSACATTAYGLTASPSMEQLLIAAGFQQVPANTPARQQELATLMPGRLVAQPNGAGFTYIMADPQGCGCLFLGDATDYQQYQSLTVQKKIAQQNADAARSASLNWNNWGPFDSWGWNGPHFVHFHGGHQGDGHYGGGGGHFNGGGGRRN
jgi:hypothetical protein